MEANRYLLRDAPGFETGRSFSRGAQHAVEWLQTDLDGFLSDDTPDYIYVHVLAPHPPLSLDPACEMNAGEGYKGFSIWHPGMSDAELHDARKWYVGQVQCVNSVLVEVAASVEASKSVALIFGDHGPDSLGQLCSAGSEWDPDQRQERLTTMASTRVPDCDMTGLGSVVNIGRRFVSCTSDGSYPDLETKTYETAPTDRGRRLIAVEAPMMSP